MIDLYSIVSDNVFLDIIFDVLQNISGGGEGIQNEIVRYLIGTVSFIVLFSISMFHRSSGFFNKKRDSLLAWGFGMGFIRNFILLAMSMITYSLTVHHIEVINPSTGLPAYLHSFQSTGLSTFLISIYSPLDHFLQITSMLLISMAFVRYLIHETDKQRMFRQIYIWVGVGLAFIMYVYSQSNAGCHISPLGTMSPDCPFDYLWHILSASLIIYPMVLIHRQPESWIVNVVMLLFGFYLLYDIGKILDFATTTESITLVNSIRHTLLNLTPLVMTWIFIKESMLRLEEQTNASKTLVEMQELFITGTSHELASPIAGMEGYLHSLEKFYMKKKDKSIVKNPDCPLDMVCNKIPITTKTLQENVQHIKSILRVMKDYGHTRDYNEIKPYDINDLTQKCYNAIRFASSTKKFPRENFQYIDCSSSDNYMVMLSPYKYRQIIENLVNNSARAIDVRKPKKPFIKIRLKCMGEGCVITVTDNGVGMTDDEMKQCFDKRWTTFENHGGTGLGLYFVKKYLDEIGGTIHIDSKKQRGTRIRIVLPTEIELI